MAGVDCFTRQGSGSGLVATQELTTGSNASSGVASAEVDEATASTGTSTEVPTPSSPTRPDSKFHQSGVHFAVKDGMHCGGGSIETWHDGTDAEYGMGHVDDLEGCAAKCRARVECAGFVLRMVDNRCSLWKQEPLMLQPLIGHVCFTKTTAVPR